MTFSQVGMFSDFDLSQHTLVLPGLRSFVNKAITFFHQTPVDDLSVARNFVGAGVYALYYSGSFSPYFKLVEANKGRLILPIYVGKAEPKGKRTGRISRPDSQDLCRRLSGHVRNIKAASTTLNIKDFRCRFVVMKNQAERDLIVPLESEMIRRYQPLWNTIVSGFGNNPVGGPREAGKISNWDVLHPGRIGTARMGIFEARREEIILKVVKFLEEWLNSEETYRFLNSTTAS